MRVTITSRLRPALPRQLSALMSLIFVVQGTFGVFHVIEESQRQPNYGVTLPVTSATVTVPKTAGSAQASKT